MRASQEINALEQRLSRTRAGDTDGGTTAVASGAPVSAHSRGSFCPVSPSSYCVKHAGAVLSAPAPGSMGLRTRREKKESCVSFEAAQGSSVTTSTSLEVTVFPSEEKEMMAAPFTGVPVSSREKVPVTQS